MSNGTSPTRPPLQLNHVVDEMLKRQPKEVREQLLSQAVAANDLLRSVHGELTNYYLAMSNQDTGAEALDLLRAQVVATHSVLGALVMHGQQFAQGNHPFTQKQEGAGPLGM